MPLTTIFQLCCDSQLYKGEEIGVPMRKPQTYRKSLYWVYFIMRGIRTHNFSGDRHWLHK